MNFILPKTRHGWTYLLLSALTGTVLATGLIALLITENVGAMHMELWQAATIYVASVAASAGVAMRELASIPSRK